MQRIDFEKSIEPEIAVLYRVALRLTLHREDSEDLVGQTLLQAAKAWERFDGRHLRSWLIQILRNCHRNACREPKWSPLPDQALSPHDFERQVSDRLMQESILLELDRLPEEYRLAITLCDLEEMSYGSAALALEIPVGTLQSRVYRGRKLLVRRLQGDHMSADLRLGRTSHASI